MTSRLPSQRQAVILVGYMGAGKSSVGRVLADRLGWTFEDLDARIERRERRTVAEIFRESGEADFRRAEHDALRELLDEVRGAPKRVIALGGGTFAQDSSVRLIDAMTIPTVFLDARIDELWRRCTQQAGEPGAHRPLLVSAQVFRELYERRRPHYMRASLRQETGGKTVEQIAAEVVRALGLNRSHGKRGEKQ
jgi:shikimate kinase